MASTPQVVRTIVTSSGEGFWRPGDFDHIGASRSAVSASLRRLAAQGELRHMRRGLWWHGRPTRFGMSLPPRSLILREILGEGDVIGATSWQAANALGLSTQVPPRELLVVSRRHAPRGLPLVVMGTRAARTCRVVAGLNGLEVTVLEALASWDRHVEDPAGRAVARLGTLLDGEGLSVERLVAASPTEPARVRERLRVVLERNGHEAEAANIPRAASVATRRRALRCLGG